MTSPIPTRRFASLIVAGACSLLAAGCASSTVRMYSGPPLPPGDIATVYNRTDAKVVSIDRVRLGKGTRTHKGVRLAILELLPGKRQIVLTHKIPRGAFTSPKYKTIHRVAYQENTLEFVAAAGETYIIGEDIEYSPFYKWTPWIELQDNVAGGGRDEVQPDPAGE